MVYLVWFSVSEILYVNLRMRTLTYRLNVEIYKRIVLNRNDWWTHSIRILNSFVIILPMSNHIGVLRTFSTFCVPLHFINQPTCRTVTSLGGHRRPLFLSQSNPTGLSRRGFKNFSHNEQRLPLWEKSGLYFAGAVSLYLAINPFQWVNHVSLSDEITYCVILLRWNFKFYRFRRLHQLKEELKRRRLAGLTDGELTEEKREADRRVYDLIDKLY